MSKSTLADRRKALENYFFHQEEKKAIDQLRKDLSDKRSQEELKVASGIEDQALLAALVSLDVGGCDISALTLVPLVQVAWSDEKISSEERNAILEAAHKQNILENSHTYKLLQSWLATKPEESLFKAWSDYVAILRTELDASQLITLKESILGLAHDVASAAGGILGLGSISLSEKSTLKTIEAVFEE